MSKNKRPEEGLQKSMNSSSKGNKTLLIIAFFLTFMTIEVFLGEKFFDLSLEHEVALRHSKYATPTLDKISRIISEFGDKYVVGLIVFIMYHFLETTNSFLIVFVTVIG